MALEAAVGWCAVRSRDCVAAGCLSRPPTRAASTHAPPAADPHKVAASRLLNWLLCRHIIQILMWKRMAEEYLVNSSLAYTVIHPGAPACTRLVCCRSLCCCSDAMALRRVANVPLLVVCMSGRTAALTPPASLCLTAHQAPRASLCPALTGGLIDQPGGQRELLVGKHDRFMDDPSGPRTIPRADVAEVCWRRGCAGCGCREAGRCARARCHAMRAAWSGCLNVQHNHQSMHPHGLQIVVQALLHDEALNKSFDVVARPDGEGQPTSRWDAFFNAATAGL